MTDNLKIWTEVQELLPGLSTLQKQQLLQSLQTNQVNIPILHLPDGRIIDGHHRWELSEHKYPYLTEVDLPEDEAFALAIALNLARRQLTLDQIKQIQESLKKDKEQQKKVAQHLRQNGKTQQETAAIIGVAQQTIDLWEEDVYHRGNTSNTINGITCVPPDYRITIPEDHKQIIYTRLQAGEAQQDIADDYGVTQQRVSQIKKEVESFASQPVEITIFSSESVEYYTPANIIEVARQLMGDIDLDPASCDEAQEAIRAERYFTKLENGLAQKWSGRVWLNPPYGKTGNQGNQEIWAIKLEQEYLQGNVSEAVLLVKSALGYNWFENLLWDKWPVCFVRERLSFTKDDGTNDGQSKMGTALFYFGNNLDKFIEIFLQFGRITTPDGRYVNIEKV